MAGPAQSFQHTALYPGSSSIMTDHFATSQQQTDTISPRTQHLSFLHPVTTQERQIPSQFQYDPEIDEVLEAESRELEALVQMHEEIASSAMEQDLPTWQQDQGGAPRSEQEEEEDMPAIPSSPTFWGSEDGDDSFEGELWRLADGGGGDEEMDLS